MPPKKKVNKKGNDDWEAELGETIDPIAAATQAAKEEEAAQDVDDDGAGGGGLMAALRKNKSRKQKKGKVVEEDFVEGEDPLATNGNAPVNDVADLVAKAPEEGTIDDAFPEKAAKGKGAKGKPAKPEVKAVDEDGDSLDESGKVKSKKEKEKEKKEREKQRKKEQVLATRVCSFWSSGANYQRV